MPLSKLMGDSPRPPTISKTNGLNERNTSLGGDLFSRGATNFEAPPGRPAAASAAVNRLIEARRTAVSEFSEERRDKVKAAFTSRRVPVSAMRTIVSGPFRPRSGDLVLARVERLRNLARIELVTGRKASLHVGDEIVVAYGDRYATDLCEAHIPEGLDTTNLIASGGVASNAVSRTKGTKNHTVITPIGLVGDDRGKPLNLMQFALDPVRPRRARPRTIAVLGTSMNSGKTTTSRYLVSGLSRAGLQPGAAKVTGTGSGGDYWVMFDAGAHQVLDFTDVGFSSTHRMPIETLETAMIQLIDHLTEAGCGAIILEIADGILQEQNRKLVQTDTFAECIDAVLFASGDSLGAMMGVTQLRQNGSRVLGVSGKLTASELLIRETKSVCDVPVLRKDDLANPVVAKKIVEIATNRNIGTPDKKTSPPTIDTTPRATNGSTLPATNGSTLPAANGSATRAANGSRPPAANGSPPPAAKGSTPHVVPLAADGSSRGLGPNRRMV